MFTPQQLDEISFTTVLRGYDKDAVDEVLEPLTEDYITLYKENALLKSKMRVLVEKLEEYRRNEASMKDAIVNAQKTCDKMVKEAEAKCAEMLNNAGATAAQSVKNADSIIANENARVEEARQAASAKISLIQEQMNACVQLLERIKVNNRPISDTPAPSTADDVVDEISSNLEALVGTTDDTPKRSPMTDATTRFGNLQFGRNYDTGKIK